jgi:hypothetical protein
VRAALELEDRIGPVALDRERVAPVPDRQRLGLEAAPVGVAREHPVEVTRPDPRLLAARAGADLDDHVLVVVGIPLDHREADLLLEFRQAGARAFEQLAQLRVVAVLGEQLAGAHRVVRGSLVLGRELCGRLQITVRARNGGEPVAVADHRRVRELILERPEASQDLLGKLVDHRSRV